MSEYTTDVFSDVLEMSPRDSGDIMMLLATLSGQVGRVAEASER